MTIFPIEAAGLLFVVPVTAGVVVFLIGAVDAVWSTVESRRAEE